MKPARPALMFLMSLAGCGISTGAVSIVTGLPTDPQGAMVVIGDSFNSRGIDSVIGASGATISFGIYPASRLYPISSSDSLTDRHVVTTPGDFELPLQSLLTLAAGDYWLVAFTTVPSSTPAATDAFGFLTMPFTIGQELTIGAIGVENWGKDSQVYLREVAAVPETSSLAICAVATVMAVASRRRGGKPNR